MMKYEEWQIRQSLRLHDADSRTESLLDCLKAAIILYLLVLLALSCSGCGAAPVVAEYPPYNAQNARGDRLPPLPENYHP